jgi:hypothetical protein
VPGRVSFRASRQPATADGVRRELIGRAHVHTRVEARTTRSSTRAVRLYGGAAAVVVGALVVAGSEGVPGVVVVVTVAVVVLVVGVVRLPGNA